MFNITRNEKVTRVELVENGDKISWLSIHNLQIYILGKTLTVGGIGGVGTKEEYRNQGYSTQVLNKAISIMTEDKKDLSLLFGIHDYYHRWGFISCLPQNRISIPTYEAEKAKSYHSIRPLQAEEISEVIAIYQINNKNRTGAIVRDLSRFTNFKLGSNFGERAECFVAEKGGKIEGYLVIDKAKRTVNVVEIGATNIAVYHSVLSFLAELAIERRVGTITGTIPSDHPFALFAIDYGVSITRNYVKNADGMGRIINQDNLLKALEDEIFLQSGLNPSMISLEFSTDLGTTKIGQGEEIYNIALDQQTLTQLIFGYRDIANLIYEERIKAKDLCLTILNKMFPMSIAHVSGPDKF